MPSVDGGCEAPCFQRGHGLADSFLWLRHLAADCWSERVIVGHWFSLVRRIVNRRWHFGHALRTSQREKSAGVKLSPPVDCGWVEWGKRLEMYGAERRDTGDGCASKWQG